MRSAVLVLCLSFCLTAFAQRPSDRSSRVVLSRCTIDRVDVPCREFHIIFQVGKREVSAASSADGSSFAIPAELEEQPRVEVVISSPRGQFRTGPLPANRVRGGWQIGVDHAPFDPGLQKIAAQRNSDCVGWITFAGGRADFPAIYANCDQPSPQSASRP